MYLLAKDLGKAVSIMNELEKPKAEGCQARLDLLFPCIILDLEQLVGVLQVIILTLDAKTTEVTSKDQVGSVLALTNGSTAITHCKQLPEKRQVHR